MIILVFQGVYHNTAVSEMGLPKRFLFHTENNGKMMNGHGIWGWPIDRQSHMDLFESRVSLNFMVIVHGSQVTEQ